MLIVLSRLHFNAIATMSCSGLLFTGVFCLFLATSSADVLVRHQNVTGLDSHMDCTAFPDGYFANPKQPCSNQYFACVGGSAIPQFCQEPLVFDQLQRACVWRNVLGACGGHDSGLRANITQPNMNDAPQQGELFHCDFVGTFADVSTRRHGCSQKFWVCAPERAFGVLMDCPPGLFYDAEMNWCDIWERVATCSGKHSTTTSIAPLESTTPIPFDCSSKPQGNYPVPGLDCPHWFIQCANGLAFRSNCPGNLRYYEKADRCLSPIAVPSCHEPAVAVNPSTSAPVGINQTTVPVSSTVAPTTNVTKQRNPTISKIMVNKVLPRKIFLGKFAHIQQQHEQDVAASHHADAEEAKDNNNTTALVQLTSAAILIPQKDGSSPIVFDCTSKPEGNYPVPGLNCPHWFIQCANGLAFRSNCPDNLRYFAKVDRCLTPMSVPSCHESTVAVTSTTVAPVVISQTATSFARNISGPGVINTTSLPLVGVQNDSIETAVTTSVNTSETIKILPNKIFVGKFAHIQQQQHEQDVASQQANTSMTPEEVALAATIIKDDNTTATTMLAQSSNATTTIGLSNVTTIQITTQLPTQTPEHLLPETTSSGAAGLSSLFPTTRLPEKNL